MDINDINRMTGGDPEDLNKIIKGLSDSTKSFIQELEKNAKIINEIFKPLKKASLENFGKLASISAAINDWEYDIIRVGNIQKTITEITERTKATEVSNNKLLSNYRKSLEDLLKIEKLNIIKKIKLYELDEKARQEYIKNLKANAKDIKEGLKLTRKYAIGKTLTAGEELAMLTNMFNFLKIGKRVEAWHGAGGFKSSMAQIANLGLEKLADSLRNTFITIGGIITKTSMSITTIVYGLVKLIEMYDHMRDVSSKIVFFSKEWGVGLVKAGQFIEIAIESLQKELGGINLHIIGQEKLVNIIAEATSEMTIFSSVSKRAASKLQAEWVSAATGLTAYGMNLKETLNYISEFYSIYGRKAFNIPALLEYSRRSLSLTNKVFENMKNSFLELGETYGPKIGESFKNTFITLGMKIKEIFRDIWEDSGQFLMTKYSQVFSSIARMPILRQIGFAMVRAGGWGGLERWRANPFMATIEGMRTIFNQISSSLVGLSEAQQDFLKSRALYEMGMGGVAEAYFTDKNVRDMINAALKGSDIDIKKLQEKANEYNKTAGEYLRTQVSYLELILNSIRNIEYTVFFRIARFFQGFPFIGGRR